MKILFAFLCGSTYRYLEARCTALADNKRGRRTIGCSQTIRCQDSWEAKRLSKFSAGHGSTQLIIVQRSDLERGQLAKCGRNGSSKAIILNLEETHLR